MSIVTVGIDLAKIVFDLHGVDQRLSGKKCENRGQTGLSLVIRPTGKNAEFLDAKTFFGKTGSMNYVSRWFRRFFLARGFFAT